MQYFPQLSFVIDLLKKYRQDTFAAFWGRHPALLYGLPALLGAALALEAIPCLFCLAISFFIFPFSLSRSAILRALLVLTLGLGSFFLTKVSHQFPSHEELGKHGSAVVEFSSISASTTPFGPIWSYKGTLLSFWDEKGKLTAKNVPVRLTVPANKGIIRPEATFRYQLNARMKENGGKYGLTVSKKTEWHPIGNVLGPAEWRFSAKSQLQQHIKDAVKNHHVAAFLSGIATGEFDDLQLSSELNRFGLQHLMAISGLHFSILASMIGFALCLVFTGRQVALGLILILSAYFFFLGNSPSVLRAWISLTIALGGIFLGKRSSGLNSLGLAVLVVAIWDPTLIYQIGFQFSFGITAAILIWYTPFDRALEKIFSKRSLSQMTGLSWMEQHAYCLLCFLRQTLSLALAVNLVALPLTLFHFHKFPLMGLVYNLFFPFMVSMSLLLLLVACFSYLIIPWVGLWFHRLNEYYTQFLLNFTFNFPRSFDRAVYVEEFSQTALLSYLLVVFVVGIYIKQTIDNEEFMPEWMVR